MKQAIPLPRTEILGQLPQPCSPGTRAVGSTRTAMREEVTPYHTWLSEIMLQQTRASAVIPYYHRFLAALPDIAALAACEEETLMKLWQGLGYYSRPATSKKLPSS